MAIFWTDEKIELLKTYLQMGLNNKNIALKMNSTYDAVSNAIKRYNLQQFKTVEPRIQKMAQDLNLEELNDNNFIKDKEQAKLKWNISKSKVSNSSKKEFEIGLIWPDTHIPHQNDNAVKAVLKLMDDVKFDKFINIGDYLDYGCISHWTKNKRKTLEMQRLKKDYILGNSLLDQIDSKLPKNCDKHFLYGNHEVWINDLLEEMPQLEGLIEPESQLFLKERGYKIYQYNDILKIGKLNIVHGMYVGGNPVKKHLDELKVNILFGHTHTMALMLSNSPAREIAFSGYNIGCLCDLNPDYMRGRAHAWSHGFAVVYFFPDGSFDVKLVRILDGKFIFNNKVYDGNK